MGIFEQGDIPSEDEANDLFAGFKALADQAVEASGQVARMMKSYYDHLIEAGFDEDKAMTLTIVYQQEFMRSGGDSE